MGTPEKEDIVRKNAGKAPSFQFYPADWLKHDGLKRCSFRAKGVWVDMLCHAWECKDKGWFRDANGPYSEEEVINMMAGSPDDKRAGWDELKKKGVLDQDEDGAWGSGRMNKDWELCIKRREAGKLGGNPSLLPDEEDNVADNIDVNQAANQNLTPSSSTSPSPSSSVSSANSKYYTPAFERAWEVYPRKIAKKAAAMAFRARVREGVGEDLLFECSRRYAEFNAEKQTGEEFIAHGSTFFGPKEKYMDYAPSQEENGVARALALFGDKGSETVRQDIKRYAASNKSDTAFSTLKSHIDSANFEKHTVDAKAVREALK